MLGRILLILLGVGPIFLSRHPKIEAPYELQIELSSIRHECGVLHTR